MISVEQAEKALINQFVNVGSEEFEQTMKLVLILDDLEELVGPDGKPLGPFMKDEIVNLPKQVADILIEDKKAEVVIED